MAQTINNLCNNKGMCQISESMYNSLVTMINNSNANTIQPASNSSDVLNYETGFMFFGVGFSVYVTVWLVSKSMSSIYKFVKNI